MSALGQVERARRVRAGARDRRVAWRAATGAARMLSRSFWRLARRVATAASVVADALVDATERRLIDAGMAETLRRVTAEALRHTDDRAAASAALAWWDAAWSEREALRREAAGRGVDDAELDVRHLHGDVFYPSSRDGRREWIA